MRIKLLVTNLKNVKNNAMFDKIDGQDQVNVWQNFLVKLLFTLFQVHITIKKSIRFRRRPLASV